MYADILETDAADMIWALMGTAMHTILERGGIDAAGMIEERLYADLDGVRISGQFDYMDADGIIWDWKLASVWEVMSGVKESREQQLNAYAYLAATNQLQVNGLRIGFILRDWKQAEVSLPQYPPHQVVTYGVKSWEQERTEDYLRQRIRLHREAAVTLPECTKEERWAKEDKYAVVRTGSKRASRLFAEPDAASEYVSAKGPSYRVEFRPGRSVRCESYCAVSDYCEQWRQLKR